VLYSTILACLLPFVLLRLAIRGFRDNRYWQRCRERFGYVQNQESRPVIWLHAVSVGEVRAASILMHRLMERYPDYQWHITTVTPTGAEMVQQIFGDTLSHSYLPYDLPWFVNRFLDRLCPSLVLIMETEIWPNLFQACHQRNIPLCMLNARMSESSCNRYTRLARFTQQTLNHLTLVTAKSELDRERFIKLGVDKAQVVCPGNVKFDINLSEAVFSEAEKLRRKRLDGSKIWTAGSTHPGEDEVVIDAHLRVLKKYPDTLLILVPRHPERVGDLAKLCDKAGLTWKYSSEGIETILSVQIIIGDRIGELLQFYAASDVAFVGGSLIPHGGQNLLEPAAVSVPILTGPNVGNFKDVYQILNKADAVVTIKDCEDLAMQLSTWFEEPGLAKAVGQSAWQVVEQNKGAVNRTLELLQPVIKSA
jgi:3-deoxy-D-manno-octulosonic-acid transferase